MSANSTSAWFYQQGGQQCGPADAETVVALRLSGGLDDNALVWREGMPGWVPFRESELAVLAGVRDLAVIPGAPPPVPSSAEAFVPRQVRMRPQFGVPIRGCLGLGWRLLTSRFWPFVGCFTLVTLILSVASQLVLPSFFLVYPLMGGFYWYALRVLRGKPADIELIFEGFRRQFAPLAILNLIVTAITFGIMIGIAIVVGIVFFGVVLSVGSVEALDGLDRGLGAGMGFGIFVLFVVAMVALIVPLVYLQAVGSLATLLILDGALDAGVAMRLAWQATKMRFVKVGVFFFVNGIVSASGMIVLGVGVLVTGAWASLAMVCLYEEIFGEESGAYPVRSA